MPETAGSFLDTYLSKIHHSEKRRIGRELPKTCGVNLKVEMDGFFEVSSDFIKGFPLREDIKIKTSRTLKLSIVIDLRFDHLLHSWHLLNVELNSVS